MQKKFEKLIRHLNWKFLKPIHLFHLKILNFPFRAMICANIVCKVVPKSEHSKPEIDYP